MVTGDFDLSVFCGLSHETKKMSENPSCWKCQHFGISWDARFPYECKSMAFKSKMLPCSNVLKIDGRPCQSFQRKLANESATTAGSNSGIIKGSIADDLI